MTGQKYNVQKGMYVKRMRHILDAGEIPLSVAGFMQHRQPILDQHGDLRVDTSDLIVYAGEKRGEESKIILTVNARGEITDKGRQSLELINPERIISDNCRYEFNSGAIRIEDIYDEIEGLKIPNDCSSYISDEKGVLDNPLWQILLRHPDAVPAEFSYGIEFMKEVVGRTFSEIRSRDGSHDGMYINCISYHGDEPSLRPLMIESFKESSDLDHSQRVNEVRGLLIGVKPEVWDAPLTIHPENGSRVSYTPEQIERVIGKVVNIISNVRSGTIANSGLEKALELLGRLKTE